ICFHVDEEPAASKLLLERVVNGHRRRGIDAFVIDVCYDADNPARLRVEADELRQAIGPLQVAVDRILSRKQLAGDALVDDDYSLGAIAIGVIEIAAADQTDSQRGEVAWRHRAQPRMRVVLRIRAPLAFNRKGKTGSQISGIAPGYDAADGDM